MFVLYDYDTNAILVEPLKYRKCTSLTAAWKKFHARLMRHGHKVNLHVLDNEISAEFVAALQEEGISYQLAPQ